MVWAPPLPCVYAPASDGGYLGAMQQYVPDVLCMAAFGQSL